VRRQFWQQLCERGAVRDLECLLRTHSGELRMVMASAEPLPVDGSVLLVFYDVTERIDREIQVHHAQKMEALGQLAAGFAHDFNNILAVVQGYTGLLMADGGLDQQVHQALKEVTKATDRAAHLTRQLLTLGRKQYLRLQPMDLNATVQRLSGMLRRVLGEKNTVLLQLAPELPGVRADASMFEQLLANLGFNARDAMPLGGELRIQTGLVRLDADYPRNHPQATAGQFVRLAVRDTGCGMDPATLDRIFEPFFTTKQIGHSSGLGLATVYGIVKQHHGWIEVSSQPKHGTTFLIFFPADLAARETAPDPLASAPPARGPQGRETILIVEDESSLNALVRSILERYGYHVFSAATGLEALRIWDQHPEQIDLVLTDLVMPGELNGAQVAQRLQAQKPGLKVIYTSGYSADLMNEGLGELVEGVNFIQKPYRPHLLAQTIRRCLDGSTRSTGSVVGVGMAAGGQGVDG
jgi:signal transduction histidine kinase/CheY-like chemotaxis protein